MVFILTTMIALFSSLSGSITFFGLSIKISTDLLPVLALITASAMMGHMMAFIDDMMLDRFIHTLGNHIGIYSFPLVLIDKMAINLWSDALTPRYFGAKSGIGHKISLGVMGVFFIIIHIFMISYPIFFVSRVALDNIIWAESNVTAKILSFAAVLIIVLTLIFQFFFIFRFKFHRADFNESDGEPTPEFVDEMNAKIAQNENEQ